ncbi:MAG: sulfate adenylyltransferase subunit CysD [Nitrospira sp.]|nr:sulfate adenylyltransferase subunit CysD [Nitrospira sp.]
MTVSNLSHLRQLEAESIHIFREVVAECTKPVMLYSIGKDSSVLLHVARKAFYPSQLPFPLLHVDTTWNFREMITFRNEIVAKHNLNLIVYTNQTGLEQGINPFTHGSSLHTQIMKTEALKQALNKYQFNVAIGGTRFDEEASQSKERIFSFRTPTHRWDPKAQRPELWNIFNTRVLPGQNLRAFPLSNWTELDIWQYILVENIPIVPLYLAKARPVVKRHGMLLLVDDERFPLVPHEVPQMRTVRFRTLGCYPLTGAIESTATTLPEVIQELLMPHTSERQNRIIDRDEVGSMEKKKQERYF